MKNKILPILLSFYAIFCFCGNLMACHEEDIGLQGHKSKWSFNGISSATEASFALTSTTTLCDTYTGFLMRNFGQIAEDASRGEGFYIEALASYHGCSIQGVKTFKSVVQNNFSELFESRNSSGAALVLRLTNVLNRYPMLREKCLILSDSSHS